MRSTKKIGTFSSIRSLTFAAMLTAMSVVIGIFCKSFLNFGGGAFRITFENLPIIMSGILFGPVVGGLVGAATDVISYFYSTQSFAIDPIVTIGAAAVGLTAGLVSRYLIKTQSYRQIILSGASAHLIGSLLIKTTRLCSLYGSVFLWRIPLYLMIAPTEILVICLLYKNSALRKIFDSIRKQK